MNCDEARGIFAELGVGELGLTEAAPAEAHAGQGPECAGVLDQLDGAARSSRRRRLPSLTRHVTVTAILVLVMGLGIFAIQRRYEVWLAGLRSVLPSLSESGGSGRGSRAQAAPQEVLAPPGVASPIEREPQDAASVRPASPASRARPEPARESASPAKASAADVIIQLSVQDRREAERDVKTLLARLGGTRLGREPAATMILVVPRAKYGELTRGLAQIGAWQMESDAGPLPNPVHVAVRLAR